MALLCFILDLLSLSSPLLKDLKQVENKIRFYFLWNLDFSSSSLFNSETSPFNYNLLLFFFFFFLPNPLSACCRSRISTPYLHDLRVSKIGSVWAMFRRIHVPALLRYAICNRNLDRDFFLSDSVFVLDLCRSENREVRIKGFKLFIGVQLRMQSGRTAQLQVWRLELISC